MTPRLLSLLIVTVAGSAYADPAPAASAVPARASAPAPVRTPVVLSPRLLVDVPALPVPSLRLEAVRIAGERSDSDWRFPEPGPLLGVQNGVWFMGYGRYSPRTKRSAALHGGSIAATIIGEILIASGTPAAGIGALLTGATLDAAAADVDRDAESRKR